MTAFFVKDGRNAGVEVLQPTPFALSGWGHDQVRGPAVTGLLARTAEAAVGSRTDLRPARATFELFRPVRMTPSTTTCTVVRKSRRLLLVDAQLCQEDTAVARASVLFLAPTDEQPRGDVWMPAGSPQLPPAGLRPDFEEQRLYCSDGVGWTTAPADHQNSSRKQVWQFPVPIVEGGRPSPFQAVAGAADLANLVISWGSAGIEFINADVTLALSRAAVDGGVGLSAAYRVDSDGIAIGTAELFDREGSLGSATVTALANFRGAVDPVARLSAE